MAVRRLVQVTKIKTMQIFFISSILGHNFITLSEIVIEL